MPIVREKSKEENEEELNAVFMVGEMAGLATRLNTDALEHYLSSLEPDSDFHYTEICRAAIMFTREVLK